MVAPSLLACQTEPSRLRRLAARFELAATALPASGRAARLVRAARLSLRRTDAGVARARLRVARYFELEARGGRKGPIAKDELDQVRWTRCGGVRDLAPVVGYVLSFRCRTRATCGWVTFALRPSYRLVLGLEGLENPASLLLDNIVLDSTSFRPAFRTGFDEYCRHDFLFRNC